jgi:hypothetical protein
METGMVNQFEDETEQSSSHDQVSASAVAAMIAGIAILFLLFCA